MPKEIRSWWSEDRKWFCIYVDDGASKATISLTPEEAANFFRAAPVSPVAQPLGVSELRLLIAREIWAYQECPWNFDDPPEGMAQLQKQIAIDEAERIRAAIAKARCASASVTDEMVGEAMLDAWNEICSDTKCHPLDIEQVGRRRLEFSPHHWAAFTAARIRRALAALTSPVAQPLGNQKTGWMIERDGKWWGPSCSRWQWEQAIAGCEPNLWTIDPNNAVRFARKEDAEQLIRWEGYQKARATEHVWLDSEAALTLLPAAGELSDEERTTLELARASYSKDFAPIGCKLIAIIDRLTADQGRVGETGE